MTSLRSRAGKGVKAAARPAAVAIDIQVADAHWRAARVTPMIRKAIRAALGLARGARGRAASLTVVLSDDRRVKALNAQFRGRAKPTNVLSFPAADAAYLGDVVLAFGTVRREAKAQGKRFAHHAAHLAAHGALHLLGYDHQNERDAQRMESLEIRALRGLGIPDPYRELSLSPDGREP